LPARLIRLDESDERPTQPAIAKRFQGLDRLSSGFGVVRPQAAPDEPACLGRAEDRHGAEHAILNLPSAAPQEEPEEVRARTVRYRGVRFGPCEGHGPLAQQSGPFDLAERPFEQRTSDLLPVAVERNESSLLGGPRSGPEHLEDVGQGRVGTAIERSGRGGPDEPAVVVQGGNQRLARVSDVVGRRGDGSDGGCPDLGRLIRQRVGYSE
jgi:hypothetical protein